MRHLVCLMLTLALLACAASALAQPQHAPYDMDLSLRYRALTPAQRQLFDLIYDGLWEGMTWIDLPDGTGYDDVSRIMQLITKDMPEMCALDSRYSLRYYQGHPEYATGINVTQVMPMTAQQDLLERAQRMVDGVRGSVVEQEVLMHDLLCAQTEYTFGRHCYTAYGALVDGEAVCEGYAKAFALLCRLRGIPCSVAEGTSMDEQGQWVGHAWNQVELNGVRAWVDVTWDDQEETLHWHVNLTDAQIGRDHILDDGQDMAPCTDDRYEWHRMNGMIAAAGHGRETVYEAFAQLAGQQQGRISIRFEDEREFRDISGDVSGVWDDYNAQAAREKGLYGSLAWMTGKTQWILELIRPE